MQSDRNHTKAVIFANGNVNLEESALLKIMNIIGFASGLCP